MLKRISFMMVLLLMAAVPAASETNIDGFLQGLYGARLDEANPTATEYSASETRLQMRLQHFGDVSEFFGRMDFTYDAADTADYRWELREGFLKFRLGGNFDFKVGRQVLTWGTGDLVFINDVFAKDYRSFFSGRDDQYLKAPQTALRMEYYNRLGSFSFVWTPRFEPNRLPTGRKFSYYFPLENRIVGEGYFFEPPTPEAKFENGEFASRFSRQVGNFNTSLYFYKGFYKNPLGFDPNAMSAVYPRLNVYGASTRGTLLGGILWLEGGYFDSRDDRDGDDANTPNSSMNGLLGFERQVAANLTANIQWQADYMLDYDTFASQQRPGVFIRDETRHLLTSRITKLLNSELITLSAFVFYSPSDGDAYVRLSASYRYTDEVTLAAGGNIFTGRHDNTEFGQFQKNDNVYLKMTYGF